MQHQQKFVQQVSSFSALDFSFCLDSQSFGVELVFGQGLVLGQWLVFEPGLALE